MHSMRALDDCLGGKPYVLYVEAFLDMTDMSRRHVFHIGSFSALASQQVGRALVLQWRRPAYLMHSMRAPDDCL